ncbi:MAG: hypothetical protein OXC91_06340 [Rhodobacteraceae bacterium]|nr:hypothetical protein [Paracoccaceae bacterium]
MGRFLATVTILIPAAVPAQTNDTITWKDDVGGWHIGIDPSLVNGCYMDLDYEGGTYSGPPLT